MKAKRGMGKTKQKKSIELGPVKSKKQSETKTQPGAAVPQNEMIQQVELGLLVPTPDNKRTIDEKSESFKDLLASVKAAGIEIAVVARPHPDMAGKLDLRAGARRLRAAQLAGFKTIPTIIRTMTDAEAINITYIENLRENLTPLQEAALIAEMLDKNGGDYQAIATSLGKPAYWVAMRANVGQNLAVEWVEELTKKDGVFSSWTIGHLELIARYGKAKQVEMLEAMKHDGWIYTDMTVENLKRHLAKEMQLLRSAPWGMDEVLVDGTREMQTCKDCTVRTGFKPMLFEDANKKDKGDKCLDMECWLIKQAAVKQAVIIKARDKHAGLVLVGDLHAVDDAEKKLGEIRDRYAYVSAKKADENAVPVIDIHTDGAAGAVKWMKPRDKGKTVQTSTVKPTRTMEIRKDELHRKRWSFILGQLVVILNETALEKTVLLDKTLMLMALAAEFGLATREDVTKYESDRMSVWSFLSGDIFNSADPNPYNLYREGISIRLWSELLPELSGEIRFGGPITQTPDAKIESGKRIAWLIGADLVELEKKAAEQFPVPKSWGKQATVNAKTPVDLMAENNPIEESESDEDVTE
jgi:ParB/RepB/Spo0J family partition protein